MSQAGSTGSTFEKRPRPVMLGIEMTCIHRSVFAHQCRKSFMFSSEQQVNMIAHETPSMHTKGIAFLRLFKKGNESQTVGVSFEDELASIPLENHMVKT